MRAFTWVTLAAAAVVVIPPWSPPTAFTLTVAVMLFALGVQALRGRV